MADIQTDPRQDVIWNYATIADVRNLGVGLPSAPALVQITDEQLGVGNGSSVEFPPQLVGGERIQLAHTSIAPNSIVVTDGTVVGTDDGAGAIIGAGVVTGVIDYTNGQIFVEFSTAPIAFSTVSVSYKYQPATVAAAGEMTDQQILDAIQLVSLRINQLTNQEFQPFVGAFIVSGNFTKRLSLPNYGKIVLLDQVDFIGVNEFGDNLASFQFFTVSQDTWTIIRNRFIDLRGSNFANVRDSQLLEATGMRTLRTWASGRNNYRLTGTFGWLHPILPKLEMTLNASRLATDTSILVNDVTGLKVGDSIVSDNNVHAIVTGVDTVLDEITVDPLVADIPEFNNPPTNNVKTKLIRVGQVPALIRYVAADMVKTNFQFASGSAEAQAAAIQSLLVAERTDNYSYRLAGPAGGGNNTSIFSSGKAEWDRILSRFTAPLAGLDWV